MSPELLKKILEEHERWLTDSNAGARANLWGANLAGANLAGANLRGVDLGGANLRGADLAGVNLRGANLAGANLWGANLAGANLWEADLAGASLWGANLREAKIRVENTEIIATKNPIQIPLTPFFVTLWEKSICVGCKHLFVDTWKKMGKEKISKLDKSALSFYEKYSEIIFSLWEKEFKENVK
jgi:hypothetical protein